LSIHHFVDGKGCHYEKWSPEEVLLCEAAMKVVMECGRDFTAGFAEKILVVDTLEGYGCTAQIGKGRRLGQYCLDCILGGRGLRMY